MIKLITTKTRAELLRDKARLDWILNNASFMTCRVTDTNARSNDHRYVEYKFRTCYFSGDKPAFSQRDAIDNEMARAAAGTSSQAKGKL